ncbi:hypothetical protein [Microbacterium sp. A93]|uniref:hypothetical protein n=1 Tax=Microbacterium sp. A93 TaxID=3450716 RepID=UPI003F43EAFA
MSATSNHPTAPHRGAALMTAGALTAALLAGCTPQPGPGGSAPGGAAGIASAASSGDAPVSLITGTRPEEQLLAVVIERHLENEGIPAEVGEPSAEPWGAAGAQQVAVVDTLAMATQLIPDTLAGEVPTPSPSPEPAGSGSRTDPGSGASPSAEASASATASDPAPATPTGHPTATGSPTPLPEGRPAADAQGTTAMVTEFFPEDTAVVGSSAGTMRLQAVATTALTGMYEMEDLTDLNGLCDRLVFSPQIDAAVYGERLASLAGCEPSRWVEPGELGVVGDLVTGRADVALMYGTDPAISDQALEPLADPARVLPEGRVVMVADQEALPDGTEGALRAVADRLDGEMLAELQRLTTGPDRLPREEAAQFWLVAAGLEETPDGWF